MVDIKEEPSNSSKIANAPKLTKDRYGKLDSNVSNHSKMADDNPGKSNNNGKFLLNSNSYSKSNGTPKSNNDSKGKTPKSNDTKGKILNSKSNVLSKAYNGKIDSIDERTHAIHEHQNPAHGLQPETMGGEKGKIQNRVLIKQNPPTSI